MSKCPSHPHPSPSPSPLTITPSPHHHPLPSPSPPPLTITLSPHRWLWAATIVLPPATPRQCSVCQRSCWGSCLEQVGHRDCQNWSAQLIMCLAFGILIHCYTPVVALVGMMGIQYTVHIHIHAQFVAVHSIFVATVLSGSHTKLK